MKKNNTIPFKPAWWLKNPHLQTLYPNRVRKPPKIKDIKREKLITPDNDFLDIDWCGESEGSLVILMHGLTGSSQSVYIKGMQSILLKQGIRSVALNFRGCSGVPNDLARGYHSGDTGDIDFLYQTIRQREPDTPLAVIGFSLGGNVLLKWLGEQGDNIDIKAAIAISVPLVLAECANKLDSGFSKNYRTYLINELLQYMSGKSEHLQKIRADSEMEKISQLGDLSKIKSFWQYDDQIVAKLHGFKDVHDYYQRSSSRQYLKHIQVPTLIIQANDDPFTTPKVIPKPEELPPQVKLEVTKGGGHVGFITGKNPFKPIYWLEKRTLEYFKNYQFE